MHFCDIYIETVSSLISKCKHSVYNPNPGKSPVSSTGQKEYEELEGVNYNCSLCISEAKVRKVQCGNSETEQPYWDKSLQDNNLGLDRGKSPRKYIDRGGENQKRISIVILVGDGKDLEEVQKMDNLVRSGRVKPKGAGPD